MKKLINKIKKSIGNMNVRVVVISWTLFLLTPMLDIFRYQLIVDNRNFWILNIIGGLSGKLFEVLLVIAVTIAFIWQYNSYHNKVKANKGVVTYISLSGGLIFLLSNYLIKIENYNYPNFLYSHFGLRVDRLIVYGFTGAVVALLAILGTLPVRSKINIKKYKLKYKLGGLFTYFGLASLLMNSGLTFSGYSNFRYLANLTYYDKFGSEFLLIKILKDRTPSSSTIIVPKQSVDWQVLGNQPVTRYFLYPRTLFGSGVISNRNKPWDAYFIYVQRPNYDWPEINDNKKCIKFYNDIGECVDYLTLDILWHSDNQKIYKVTFSKP